MTSPLDNHHIIPQELFGEGIDLLDNLGPSFSMNSTKYKIMGLPRELNGVFTQHNGPHKGYTDWVRSQIDLIQQSPVTLDQKKGMLIGLTNVLKLKLAEPGFLDQLNTSVTPDYDWFVSSEGGRERYFGGDGLDTVTYFNASSGVIASLRNGATVDGKETGYGSGGVAARDLYFETENLVGSRFDDSLTGSNARNQLNGLEGDDFIFGYGGVDYMMGGAGDDTINGGSGSDYAIFAGKSSDYELARDGNVVTVTGADGTDMLIDVEYFRFDDGDLNIWGL